MRKQCSNKEINENLKALTVVIDTREQVNGHVTGYLDKRGIPYVSRKLDVGDYSFQAGDSSFDDEVVIERKNSIDEIAGNFTNGRLRFENEFLRAKAAGVKVFLIVENGSWQQIKSHDYRSKMKPNALMASLLSWQVRYGVTINFCKPDDTAELIYGISYYWLRERLAGAC
jgi:ERCC4-type nuclease